MSLDFKHYVVAAAHLTLPVGSVIALPPEDVARHFHLLRYAEGRHGWFETLAGIDLLRGQAFCFQGELPLTLVQDISPVVAPPVEATSDGDDSDDGDADPVIPVSPAPVPSAPVPPVEEETSPEEPSTETPPPDSEEPAGPTEGGEPEPEAPVPPVEAEPGSQDDTPDDPGPADPGEAVVNPDAPPSAARARRRG